MAAILAAAALAAGCEGQQQGGASSNAPAAAIQESDLATPADFEDEAEKQITPASYKAELDTLEKEIDTEK